MQIETDQNLLIFQRAKNNIIIAIFYFILIYF